MTAPLYIVTAFWKSKYNHTRQDTLTAFDVITLDNCSHQLTIAHTGRHPTAFIGLKTCQQHFKSAVS